MLSLYPPGGAGEATHPGGVAANETPVHQLHEDAPSGRHDETNKHFRAILEQQFPLTERRDFNLPGIKYLRQFT